MKHRLFGALAIASVLAGSGARAEGFALNRYEPAERGSEWFGADSLDLRGHARPAVGATFDWAYKPLVVATSDLAERAALVEHQVFAHVGGSIVLWDRVRFGINLPVAIYQSGENARANGTTLQAPSGAAVGDLRLGATARLLGVYGDPFTLAIATWLHAPTGSRAQMTGDGAARLHPHLLAAGDMSSFVYAVRLGPNLRFADREWEDAKVGSELSFAASAGVRLLNKKLVVGPEAWGSTVFASAFDKANTPLEVGASAHYTEGSVRFGLGATGGLTYGYGTPVTRALASIEWVMPYDAPPPAPPPPPVVEKKPEPPPPPPPVVEVKKEEPPPPPPPPPVVEVVGKEIKISEQIKFTYNSAVIEKGSDALLATIAKVLTDNPQILRVRVEGHTDDQGTDEYNQTLSEQRAQAVVDWLVKTGIAKSRLHATGMGRKLPLDPGKTEAARANNRRVEFHIEETKKP
jgi:OOP family OmpA-OmpF porin